MPRFACGKRRQLLSLLALGLICALLALAQSGPPTAVHDAAATGPVTAGYWDGPQLLRF